MLYGWFATILPHYAYAPTPVALLQKTNHLPQFVKSRSFAGRGKELERPHGQGAAVTKKQMCVLQPSIGLVRHLTEI
jgi:hypothetical protein